MDGLERQRDDSASVPTSGLDSQSNQGPDVRPTAVAAGSPADMTHPQSGSPTAAGPKPTGFHESGFASDSQGGRTVAECIASNRGGNGSDSPVLRATCKRPGQRYPRRATHVIIDRVFWTTLVLRGSTSVAPWRAVAAIT